MNDETVTSMDSPAERSDSHSTEPGPTRPGGASRPPEGVVAGGGAANGPVGGEASHPDGEASPGDPWTDARDAAPDAWLRTCTP